MGLGEATTLDGLIRLEILSLHVVVSIEALLSRECDTQMELSRNWYTVREPSTYGESKLFVLADCGKVILGATTSN